MCKTDPENIIGKIEMFVEDLERYAKENNTKSKDFHQNSHLCVYYDGQAQAYAFCAKWLKAYIEGKA